MIAQSSNRPASIAKQWQNWAPAVQFGSAVFIITRLLYSLWAIIILSVQPASPNAPQPPLIRNALEKWLLAVWYRWDAEWFLKIAREGYALIDGRSAYYPLYPALIRITGALLGGNTMLSGLLVSNAATWLALILLYKITRRHFDRRVAQYTVIALAVYPFYIFNLIYYADSLLLLFSLATFYALESRRWGWVGLFAALAVLSKLPGLVLLAPIIWEFIAQRRRLFSKDALALLAIPLTIVGWTIILRFIGSEVAMVDFSSPMSIFTPILTPSFQQKFSAELVWPWEGIWLGIQAVFNLWGHAMGLKVTLDIATVAIFTLLVPLSLKLPVKSYFIYSLGLYCMNLMLVVKAYPLADFPRRMMVAFPVFIILGLTMRKRRSKMLIVGSGLGLSALVSAFLLWWMWVG